MALFQLTSKPRSKTRRRPGQIRCLVATATLTEGVNLPFKAVIVGSTGYGFGDNFVEIIDAPRLVNALGRAGRACRETEAWLFLVRHETYHQAMFNQLRQEGADLPLRSSLVADEALEDLAAFELLVAAGVDAALRDTGTSTNEFCSFVWHLAELLGAVGAEPDLDAIMSVVEVSLAWVQADDALQQRWRNLVESAKKSYDTTPSATRRRYAQCGASLVGAAALDSGTRRCSQRCRRGGSCERPRLDHDPLGRWATRSASRSTGESNSRVPALPFCSRGQAHWRRSSRVAAAMGRR